MIHRTYRNTVILFAVIATSTLGSAYPAVGQQEKATHPMRLLVQRTNQSSEARHAQTCKQWRSYVASLGKQANLQRMAKDISSMSEKIGQATDLWAGSYSQSERIRLAFGQHVINEKELSLLMTQAFAGYQEELVKETRALMLKAGKKPVEAEQLIQRYRIDSSNWDKAFNPLIAKAKTLSQEDWFRIAAVTAGSGIIAEGLTSGARQSGVWRPKQGSWEEMIGGFLTHLAVEALVDNLTDPSEMFAKKLRVKFDQASHTLLDGKRGLLTVMKLLTDYHKALRLKHLIPVKKGAK